MRKGYIDIVKGWAIVTIVLFHISFSDGSVFSKALVWLFGNQWNVPMFFILAGFFVKYEDVKRPALFLKNKFYSLYVPATIVYLAVVLLHNVFVNIGWYPVGGGNLVTKEPFMLYGLGDFAFAALKVLLCGGSGELAMGAMWFVYVLVYAFVFLTIMVWAVSKIVPNKRKQLLVVSIILFLSAAISNVATQRFGFTISRISTMFTIMPLMFIGWIMNNVIKFRYKNKCVFVLCSLVFVFTVLMNRVHISLALNRYENLFTLVAGSCSALWVCLFVARKIENTHLGRLLGFVGRNSFAIMALHIIGFFICNSLLEYWGIFTPPYGGLYTYNLNGDFLLVGLYVFAGVGFPLAVVSLHKMLSSANKRKKLLNK